MKKIEAVVRTETLPMVKEKLRAIGIGGMTISNVSGWSKKRELNLQWRGQAVAFDLLPRVKFEVVIPDSQEDLVIKSIIESARTGEHGDGVIFVSAVETAIHISTMERGDSAIMASNHDRPSPKPAE
ncbi:MAG: P-II family nitrogen regulator [Nitrososphaera sp.]